MPSFAEIIIHMLVTIITNTASTIVSVVRDILILIKILADNIHTHPAGVLAGIVILAVIIYMILKFLKGNLKTIAAGIAVLFILFLILSLV